MITEKPTITINRELPATRCDICHQADCFTPETGVCTRCVGLLIPDKPVPLVHRSPVFETLSRYQRSTSRVPDWLMAVISVLPVLFLVAGWFSGNDDKTILWWEIAYGASLLLLIFGIFFRKEEEVESVDTLLLWINAFIAFAPVVLLILFFLIGVLVRYY